MGAAYLRVVLAENGLSETGLTLRSLCAEMGQVLELVRVERGEDLEQVLRAHCPDVALLKLALLQPDATRRLRVLQENSPSIPFILLADPADNVSGETCLAFGAVDYLVEGYLDERTMSRVLSSAMGTSMEVDVKSARRRSRGNEWVFTVGMGDAEQVQAWLGNAAVSEALESVAETVRKSVRSTDEVKMSAGCELEVRIRNVDESKRATVQKRIEARLRSAAVLLLRELDLEVAAIETEKTIGEEGPHYAFVQRGDGARDNGKAQAN